MELHSKNDILEVYKNYKKLEEYLSIYLDVNDEYSDSWMTGFYPDLKNPELLTIELEDTRTSKKSERKVSLNDLYYFICSQDEDSE